MIPTPSIIVGENSYISILDANAYLKNRLYTDAWFDNEPGESEPGDCERALITASGQISRFVTDGYKLPLASIIPDALKRATCELALMMLVDVDTVTNSDTGQNIRRVKAGSAEVEFIRGTKGSRFPKVVMDILIEAGMVSVGGSSGESYGTDLCSTFESSNFDLNKGLL